MRFLALLACLAATFAAAAPASPADYPWNSRKPEPVFAPAVNYLEDLWKRDAFVELEAALVENQRSTRIFDSGRPVAIAGQAVFEWFFRRGVASEVHERRIARWKAAVPESVFLEGARAIVLTGEAWNTRGEGYANSVSAESWALFHKRLKEAERVLQEAPAAFKGMPLWHVILLDVKLPAGVEGEVQRVFEEAVKRWPDYYPFYEDRASYLVPKWGGSWRALEAFADQWTRRRTDGQGLYTRIYLWIKDGQAIGETGMNWPRMKQGFRELIAAHPGHAYLTNYFASFSCALRDRPAYLEAMKRIDAETLRPKFWLKGNSHEACARWGATET
jgi:hypothetical protein